MNKHTLIYSDDVMDELDLKVGTLTFIKGKVGSCLNAAPFTATDIGEWIKGLKVKHPKHPVITDLKKISNLMKRNKVDLVLW